MSDLFKKLNIDKEKLVRLIVFVALVAIIYSIANYVDISKVVIVVFLIALTLVMLFAWSFAIDVVMRSLFVVGAGLSLIIFLGKSYCELPNTTSSGKEALGILVSSGILYLTVKFFYHLYKEMDKRHKSLKDKNNGKRSWLFLITFTLFVGLLVFALGQVVVPIINSLCVKIW